MKLRKGKRPKELKMRKYEVWVKVWSEEYGKQVKVVAGEFDKFVNAKLFAEAYNKHYSATAEIVEHASIII